MMVIPIVFVCVAAGGASLSNFKQLGRIGGKSFILYIGTTALAISIALVVARSFQIGQGLNYITETQLNIPTPVPLKTVLLNIFPLNPFHALANGDMLQIIVFALFLGITLTLCGKAGQRIADGIKSFETVIIKMIMLVMQTAPYGVFFLITSMFYQFGWAGLIQVTGYISVLVVTLIIQAILVYSLFLKTFSKLSPIVFFKKMYSAMLFAFSVSSSSAAIPVVLNTVKNKLGVSNRVASFVIPVGATINMDGTAIMQGVATVFIANIFHVHLSISEYLTVILMATLASIGTAGVPSAGLITLAMVLEQVGIPVKGIALIFGVDRILDMMRTAINVAGDATIACIVAKTENQLDSKVFNAKS